MNRKSFAATAKAILMCWLLPVASGVLMALALPPFNNGQTGWISLIPLLFALEGCGRGEAFRRGYVAGLVFFGMTMWWIIHVTLPGMVGLVAFLALYFGAAAVWFAELLAYAGRARKGALTTEWQDVESKKLWERPSGRDSAASSIALPDSAILNVIIATFAAAGWVTLEWIRGWFLFGGFGWNNLGVTQYETLPLIQFASFTGVYGVSALVCFLNFTLFFTARRLLASVYRERGGQRLSYEFYLATVLICAALMHGMRTIRREESHRKLNLTLVQGNIPQSLKFDPNEKPMILERYRTLTEQALAAQAQPDLIIWPESAMPEPVLYDEETYALVTNLVERAGTPLLTGTLDMTPHHRPLEGFNSAVLIRPDGSPGGMYRKMHLVPFGEYVPWRKALPFMKWLTPIGDNSFERGRDFTRFDLLTARFAVVICFEDTVPDLYRQFVQRDVDFMVNVTNDGWFKESPASELQLANAIFRAIETHRPLVRATNNGVTCVVDEFGYVKPSLRLQPFKTGWLNCELALPRTNEMTFYTRRGDVFAEACALLTAAGVAWFLWKARR